MTNEQNAPAPDADWVMVPREATHEMKAAGMETSPMYQVLGTGRRVSVSDEDAGAIYAAMLAAAPKPAAPGEDAVREMKSAVIAAVAELAKLGEPEAARQRLGEAFPIELLNRESVLRIATALADKARALTHPGHKHAQEDAAQEGDKRCPACGSDFGHHEDCEGVP